MDGTLLNADCLEQLGLTQQPFLPQWQAAFGFADTSLDMPLNVTLEHLRDASPPVLIKGEYGIGKSTQLQRLMARGDDLHFCLIEAGPDTSMAAVDYAVRLQWQPHPRHGEPKKLSLDRYLAALCEDGMRPVLLVDDAHHLEPKVLGTLLNLKQHMRNKLGQTLGVVLTGERSIDDTLALLEGKLRIVDELYAISARPLNREQTAQYIQHRLEAAGRIEPMPLDADALDAIQQQTGGLPRDVNAAAVAALQAQCELGANGRKTVGERRKGLPGRLLMPVAIVLVVIGLLASLYGLIAGLLGTDDKSETALQGESTGAKLAIPAPTESKAPSPSEGDAESQAPAPAVAPAPEATPPEEVAEAPEEGVPRPEPETAAEPAPPESPPRFDFTADFEATQTAEAPPSTPAPAAEKPVAAPPAEAPPPATEPPPATPPPERVSAPSGELHDALWFMRQDPDHYTIQALGVSSEAAAAGFYTRHGNGLEAVIAPTRRAGKDWYVLVIGVFSTADQARRAIESLPAPIQRNQPFIRRIGDIQEAILDAR
jgi:DamX protein